MGLASSQCRLLMLTARKDDLEANLMSVANTKLALTRQTQAAAEKYSRALDTTKYQMANTTGTSNVDLTYGLMMDYTQASNIPGQYMMEDSSGRVVLSDSDAQLVQSITGSTGAGFSVTTDIEKAYLQKKMGITADQATTYVSGYTPGSQVSSAAKSYDSVSSALDALSNSSANTFSTDEKKSYNWSDLYNASSNADQKIVLGSDSKGKNHAGMNTEFESIVTKFVSGLKTLGTFDSTALDKAYANTIKQFENSDDILYKHDYTDDRAAEDNTIVDWRKKKTHDHTYSVNAKNLINSFFTYYQIALGITTQDGTKLAVSNKVDSTNNYTKTVGGTSPTAANTTNGTAVSQPMANFYLNQLNAMGSNGFVDVSYATNSSSLQNALKNQAIYLVKYQGNNAWGQTTTSDSSSALREVDDTDAQTKAEAEYKAETARLNTKEAQLDLQEKNYDTERSEVDTEIDSVKTILNKNVERSFKMFQA